MGHRLAWFCADQGLDGALRPELVEAFVAGRPGRPGSLDQGHLPLGAALARGPAGRRGPRLLAALPPKRPTAPEKEQSFCRSPPLSARSSGGARRSPSWPWA